MRSSGFYDVLLVIGGVATVFFYAAILYALWKFYLKISGITEDIARIRHALERNGGRRELGTTCRGPWKAPTISTLRLRGKYYVLGRKVRFAVFS